MQISYFITTAAAHHDIVMMREENLYVMNAVTGNIFEMHVVLVF